MIYGGWGETRFQAVKVELFKTISLGTIIPKIPLFKNSPVYRMSEKMPFKVFIRYFEIHEKFEKTFISTNDSPYYLLIKKNVRQAVHEIMVGKGGNVLSLCF